MENTLSGMEFEQRYKVAKVDEKLGLVIGFGIVCREDGVDYFDTQGDNIPEDSMLEASMDFMQKSRAAHDMHDGQSMGQVVFAFPLTTEIAEALDITTKRTGLLIGMKPSAEVLEKFRSGEYTGFSIGGRRIEEEVVEG